MALAGTNCHLLSPFVTRFWVRAENVHISSRKPRLGGRKDGATSFQLSNRRISQPTCVHQKPPKATCGHRPPAKDVGARVAVRLRALFSKNKRRRQGGKPRAWSDPGRNRRFDWPQLTPAGGRGKLNVVFNIFTTLSAVAVPVKWPAQPVCLERYN